MKTSIQPTQCANRSLISLDLSKTVQVVSGCLIHNRLKEEYEKLNGTKNMRDDKMSGIAAKDDDKMGGTKADSGGMPTGSSLKGAAKRQTRDLIDEELAGKHHGGGAEPVLNVSCKP